MIRFDLTFRPAAMPVEALLRPYHLESHRIKRNDTSRVVYFKILRVPVAHLVDAIR